MTAAILSIGTELTRGELVDTNAQWLAEQLTALGFDVIEKVTVADEIGRVGDALRRLSGHALVVVVTGGLGPTSDDLTSEAAAEAAGVRLVRDKEALQGIRDKFTRYGRAMPESNAKQADFPNGAEVLPNGVGTAPGFALSLGDARCFFLPGVPKEMKPMFAQNVVPKIAPLAERNSHQVRIRTFGFRESEVADILSDMRLDEYSALERDTNVVLAYRAHFPEIEIKVLARSGGSGRPEAVAERVAAEVRKRLGDAVFGGADDSFAGHVGQVLRKHNLTLAVAESCTGGLVGKLLTDVPGSSDYLLLDAVTYANAAKSRVLGVDEATVERHGAVSGEVAQAMAQGALRVAGSDMAVAVTGVAGPGGGTQQKPVGTVWLALARRGAATVIRQHLLPGDRDRIRTRSAYLALEMVAKAAQGRLEPD